MIRFLIIYSNGCELQPTLPADGVDLDTVNRMIGPTAVIGIDIIAVEILSVEY